MHETKSSLAGKKVKIKAGVTHRQVPDFDQKEIEIEDWHDRIMGKSWMFCDGNPACLIYAMRTAFSKNPVPTDDEVLYGKIDGLGYLVHISELEIPK